MVVHVFEHALFGNMDNPGALSLEHCQAPDITSRILVSSLERSLKEVHSRDSSNLCRVERLDTGTPSKEERIREHIPQWQAEFSDHEEFAPPIPDDIDVPIWKTHAYVLSYGPVADCFTRHLLHAGWSVGRLADFVDTMQEWIGRIQNFDYTSLAYDETTHNHVADKVDPSVAHPCQPVLTVGGPDEFLNQMWKRWWFEGQEETARAVIKLWGKPYLSMCPPSGNPGYPSHGDPGYAMHLIYNRSWWHSLGPPPEAHCSWCGEPLPKGGEIMDVKDMRKYLPKRTEMISVDNEALVRAAKANAIRGPLFLASHYLHPSIYWTPVPSRSPHL